MNKELIQTIFNIGVFTGRDMERDFVKNYDELQRKYVNFIDWEAERMLEVLDELKIEERELKKIERRRLYLTEWQKRWGNASVQFNSEDMDSMNIPTKLITLTYKREKKEIYE